MVAEATSRAAGLVQANWKVPALCSTSPAGAGGPDMVLEMLGARETARNPEMPLLSCVAVRLGRGQLGIAPK